jgi:hypothetical protein
VVWILKNQPIPGKQRATVKLALTLTVTGRNYLQPQRRFTALPTATAATDCAVNNI